tara:strand:- start:239 stop:667 length:429 start_codon:yes stop_codon:yes gene_type:complete
MSKASDLARLVTSGSTAIHGEAGTTSSGSTGATTNLQQGLCKQWIHFNGEGTVAILDSFNTTSITDNGTGDYQVTIANDMANDDFSVTGTICSDVSGTNVAAIQGPAVNEHAVSSYQVYTGSNTTTQDDVAVINLHTMGDLA